MTNLKELQTDESLVRLGKLSEEQRAEFDALDFIGEMRLESGRSLWAWEEFHSGVLAWLLDPKESHGLGDLFLTQFLLRAGVRTVGRATDWRPTEVTREWENVVDGQRGYLDILIVNQSEHVLCAIENKVFSSEHSEQLTRYRKALERVYPTFTRYLVFLSPGGTQPFREEEKEHWKTLTYSAVFDIIQEMLGNNDNATDESVRAFLTQYATTVRRNLMPETSVSKLARKIYLEHREAVDLLIESQPDWVAEAKQWLKEAVARQAEWALDLEDKEYVRFRSTDWDRYTGTQTGNGWAPRSNALLLFQFTFDDGLPWLELALSTVDTVNSSLRKKLFETVRQHPQLFKLKSDSLTDSWVTLHQQDDYILDDADYGVGWDDGTTRAKIEAWVEHFAGKEFTAMNEIIVACLREHEAEQ